MLRARQIRTWVAPIPARWGTPSARSSNFLSTVANSLANGSETSVVTYDNSSSLNQYGLVTIKLGSINPSSGGTITLRMTLNDGTDANDTIGGLTRRLDLTSGSSAKIIMTRIRLPPYLLRFSIINNTGVTLAASGNELYVTPYNYVTG